MLSIWLYLLIIYLYLDSISIPQEDSTFFEKLSADFVIKEPVNDFHTCDFNRYKWNKLST